MKINGAICSFLLLLAGCSCEKKEEKQVVAGEEVLVSKNGKPLLTIDEFKEFINEAMGADQQMQFMAQIMPDFEEQLLERAKMPEYVLDEWAKEANIAADADYKKMRAQAEKALNTMLNQKMFIKKHVGEISESDAKSYYDANKTQDPALVMTQEGVEAKGISFDKEIDAKNFLAKVNELKGDMVKAAQEIKKELDDFGLVSQMSMIDSTVKEKLLELKKFPQLLPIIKANDKEFWVVKAFKKEKVQYVPFEQAKDRIKESLTNKKIEEAFEKKLPEYQKKYGIEINRTYFDRKRKEREEQHAKMMSEMKEKENQEKKQEKTDKNPAEQAKELVQASMSAQKAA